VSALTIDCMLPLFVPADRPERIARALVSGADAVIVDLEDAVAPEAKATARNGLVDVLREAPPAAVGLLLRINARGTAWHDNDLAIAAALPIHGIVLPKVEDRGDVAAAKLGLTRCLPVIALIESAAGMRAVYDIASQADRLAFGSIDFSNDLGCDHCREALLLARSEIVVASRVARLPAPLDGVTLSINDDDTTQADARYAVSLGFGGKLLIHPAQIAPARRGLTPSESDRAWAQRIVGSAGDGSAAAIDGAMVDPPVLARARAILRRFNAFSTGDDPRGP
jgi:citrate lyase subunit beta / citryl-CoA lyase